jgi:hypothetical protein
VYGRKRKEWMETNKTELKIQTSKIVSYNASAEIFYNTLSSLVRFENKNRFIYLKNDIAY